MNSKLKIFTVLSIVFAVNLSCWAVSTRQIDDVRDKAVLDSDDLTIIDDFVVQAVQELLSTRDFTSIAKIRAAILSRNNSNVSSAAEQYASRFSASAHKCIADAFELALGLASEDVSFKVTLNLLILVDELKDLRLADLAMAELDDESPVIRYWAVHAITNPAIVEQLNSGKNADLQLAKNIIERLEKLISRSNADTIALIAQFAADVKIPQGENLLLQIADVRISEYANWTVKTELLDASILKLLCDKIISNKKNVLGDKTAFARRFWQLYSYAMQRYIKGKDFLDEQASEQLISTLVEVEKTCISKLMEMPQSVIKRAIEHDSYDGLLHEHNRLFGDGQNSGQLTLKLNFDYGDKSDGSGRVAPLVLPQPPEK